LFAGIPILIWFLSFTIISIGSILLLLFIFGAVGLLQWKYFKNHIDMEYRHYAMFAFTGLGMFTINILLFINYNVRIAEHTEIYTIVGATNYNHKTEIAIAGLDSNVEGKVNNFLNERNKEVPQHAKKIVIIFNKGLFGFDMIGDCKFN
jgi:hypothetical protein